MVAFTYSMPSGIPGDINRVSAATVEAQVITPSTLTLAPKLYGVPLAVGTAGMRTITSTDTAVYGLLARPFPTGGSQDPLGTSTPPTTGACDVLVRGYMTVLMGGGAGAASKGGAIYVWAAANSGSHVQGTFETVFSSGNTITVPGYYMGPADANGNVEVAFNI